MIPYNVIETGRGFKLVSAKYKGKGKLTDKQPELNQFCPKDQAKLKSHVRQHYPCVSVVGGKLSTNVLQDLLRKSYDKNLSDYKDYNVDKGLSDARVQVYHNPHTKHTIVAHRGTADIHDVLSDIRYALGNSNDQRFQHSKDIQRRAAEKYGGGNMTAIGHSLGAAAVEKASKGQPNAEVITLNKPVSPYDVLFHKVSPNQTDYKTTYDPVSFLRKFQRGKKANIISSNTMNPLKEHSIDTLDYVKGEGFVDWDNIKWGSFADQYKRFKQIFHNTSIESLEEFAKYILQHPKKYSTKTTRRARFYLNVILKKKYPKDNIEEPMARREYKPKHYRPKGVLPMEDSASQEPPSGGSIVHHYHHHIHHNAGEGILDDLRNAFDPNRNGVAKAFDPKQNGAAKTFGNVGQVLRNNLRPIIHGIADSGISALTGVPLSGSVIGQLGVNKGIDKGLDKMNLGFGLKRKPRFAKGSQEAKDFMASLRAKRGSKGSGITPGPPSRGVITDPILF